MMDTQSSHPISPGTKQQAAAKTAESPLHDHPSLPELRLVLLGRKGTGKSSSGNTILGVAGVFESGKPTEECVKRRADTARHRVTVVDTPGWEWYYSGNGTPAWVTRETMRSVTVCPPGPHALLLVMRSFASVTEDYYKQVEEHLELLGKTAWPHTMLLFTHGEELGSIPIEQRLQNAGKSFQKLLERCGNRFHVLENKRCGKDGAQVKELIRKIEEMVKERGGRHYEYDPLLLGIEAEGKRRARERRKKQRIMEAQAQKAVIKAVLTSDIASPEDLDEMSLFSRGSRRLTDLRLILLGERETGKSSAGNTILRGTAFFQTGQATEECSRQQAEISGRLVTVVDVPGWEGGPEGITPDKVKREISTSVTLCPPGPHAFLLTLRVDALVKATAVREHLELLGEGVWRHIILLFTRGDQLREGVTIEQHIQGGGKDLHWLMEKCGNRYHVISSTVLEGDTSKTQVTALLEKIEKMVSGNRCEAFSPVVQEIQELGKQKNERFNVKLKEVNEKLQRQEVELKRMREREVKSIRRLFDWRKDKVKSPENKRKEKGEGMDRTEDDRKSIMSELEERMAWLTEDREKEIHELGLENNRIIAALNQGYREKGEIIIKLEEKERENEEFKEKVDELQVNIIDLKRVSMLKEQERIEREEKLTKRHEDAENELKGQLNHKQKEGEELKGRVEEMQKMMAESKLTYERDILIKRQEQEKMLAEKNGLEKRLEEKQKEMEEMKLKTEITVRELEEKLREMSEKREAEKNKLSEMIELMTTEMEDLQVAFRQQVKSSEAARQMHEDTVLKYNQLVDKLVGKDAEIGAIKQRQSEQEMATNIEIQKKLKEKDAEISDLVKKHMEKEQEIEILKQSFDAKQRTMENEKNDTKVKMAEYVSRIKDLENEYKEMEEFLRRENVIIKEEMDIMKHLNEEMARKKDDDTRKTLEAKENTINHLQQQNEDSITQIEDFKKQLNKVQIKVENLKNQNAALIQDLDGLHITCEEYKRDLQAQIIKNESREKEIKDILNQSEEMGKIKDALNQEHIKKKENEINSLKQTNHMQQMELEVMNERGKDLEKRTEEMKNYYEERLSERIAEMDVKDAERERRLHNREMELCEREQILDKNMKELERGKKGLEKRDNDINCREEELRDEKQQLHKREDDVRNKENEIVQRGKELTQKEKELESKYNEQRDLSEKQELKREMLTKQLEEKENGLKKIEEELAIKQNDLQDQSKELECHKKNLDIRDEKFRKREQQLLETKQLYEAKIQDLSKSMQALEQNKQDIEKQQAELTTKECSLMQRSADFQNKEQELFQREHDLQIKYQELRSIKDMLDKREQECVDKQKELDIKEKQIAKKYEDFEAAEKILETKEKAQREFSEKHEKEIENIKQQLEEKEQQLTTMQDEIFIKQSNLEKEKKDLENLRENLANKEKELKKIEQELLNSDELCKVKAQELENSKLDNEKCQAELNNKEYDLFQKTNELHKKEQELVQKEHDINIKYQDMLEANKKMEEREHELLCKQKIQAAETDQSENELETIKHGLAMQEQELRSIKDMLEKREQECNDREKELDMKEKQFAKKYEDYEAAEKILETKEEAQREFSEKEEREIENIKQQLEAKEQELMTMHDELSTKQHTLQKEKKDLEILRENLDNRGKEFMKREQELLNSEEMCKVTVQELEKIKLDNEKWQAELTNKEYDLLQRSNELNKKEQELVHKELKNQELLGKNHEVEPVQQQLLSNQQKEMSEKWQSELEDFRSTLAKREQELAKKEDEFQKREQNIRSAEIYLDKREIIVQKREGEVQTNKEENDRMMNDIKKKQEIIEETKCSIETKQQELCKLEKEFGIREHNVTNKEQDLNNLHKELEIKEHNMEKQELDLKLKNQAFKKTEQELNELKITLESRKNYLDTHTSEIENQKREMNIEKQMLKMKSEQLEKWGKYLYNMELKMINSNPSPDFQPWNQRTASNITQTWDNETMYQEIGIDNRTCDNGNNSAVDNDQSLKMASISEITNSELENEVLSCQIEDKITLNVKIKEYKNGAKKQEAGSLTKEDDIEEFFESAGSDCQVNLGIVYQLSELKLMLIGEAWSSHQTATRTILGQDVEVGKPWRGRISGKPLLVVEPHGIKWRCSRDMTFQKDLIHSVSLCKPGPHALVLLLPAYLTFTGQYKSAVEYTMAMLGDAAWKHTVVLFTWAEALGESGQQHIKRNSDLEWLIQKCGGRYHVLDNRHREAHVVEFLDMIYEMVAANHGHYYQAQ